MPVTWYISHAYVSYAQFAEDHMQTVSSLLLPFAVSHVHVCNLCKVIAIFVSMCKVFGHGDCDPLPARVSKAKSLQRLDFEQADCTGTDSNYMALCYEQYLFCRRSKPYIQPARTVRI